MFTRRNVKTSRDFAHCVLCNSQHTFRINKFQIDLLFWGKLCQGNTCNYDEVNQRRWKSAVWWNILFRLLTK